MSMLIYFHVFFVTSDGNTNPKGKANANVQSCPPEFKPQSKASNSHTDLKLPQALIALCSVCLNVVFYKLWTNLDPLYLSKF